MTFDDACADLVVSNTVLHFARDDAHFESMLQGSWRILKPGGLFFCRLGSSIGMESQVKRIQGRRYRSPDGSERYLVDEALLGSVTERLGAELADPLRTTVVHGQRAMTTWVLRKKRPSPATPPGRTASPKAESLLIRSVPTPHRQMTRSFCVAARQPVSEQSDDQKLPSAGAQRHAGYQRHPVDSRGALCDRFRRDERVLQTGFNFAQTLVLFTCQALEIGSPLVERFHLSVVLARLDSA